MFLKYRQNWHFIVFLTTAYKTTGIFIDIRKAFDLVNHKVLLKTLELGLLVITIGWTTYLGSR